MPCFIECTTRTLRSVGTLDVRVFDTVCGFEFLGFCAERVLGHRHGNPTLIIHFILWFVGIPLLQPWPTFEPARVQNLKNVPATYGFFFFRAQSGPSRARSGSIVSLRTLDAARRAGPTFQRNEKKHLWIYCLSSGISCPSWVLAGKVLVPGCCRGALILYNLAKVQLGTVNRYHRYHASPLAPSPFSSFAPRARQSEVGSQRGFGCRC